MSVGEGRARARPGRAVGIDLGSRRIGIAVTDTSSTMALPRATLERSGDPDADRRRLVAVITDEEDAVATVVVGLPLSLDGSEGPAAVSARAEAAALAPLLADHGIEVELFDERLSTVSAHQALAAGGVRGRERRRVVDQAAAAVMLSAWLASGRRR